MTTGFSIKTRLVHMVLFELIGIILFAPLAAFVLHKSVLTIGLMGAVISLIAMLWNFIYNLAFDLLEAWLGGSRFKRSIILRILHACLFELGLLIVTVPLVAWWLGLSLWAAFVIDIGFVVFFLIYAFAFNWSFDWVYLKLTR